MKLDTFNSLKSPGFVQKRTQKRRRQRQACLTNLTGTTGEKQDNTRGSTGVLVGAAAYMRTQRWWTTSGLLLIFPVTPAQKKTVFKCASLLWSAILLHTACLRWAVQTPHLITEQPQLEGTHEDHWVQLLTSHKNTPKSNPILKIFILTDLKAMWKIL